MSPHTSLANQHALLRLWSEFLEMPDLRLTCRQAQRLFGLKPETCLQLLDWLVDAGFLGRGDDGTYGRIAEGRVHFPRLSIGQAFTVKVERGRTHAGETAGMSEQSHQTVRSLTPVRRHQP
jgi:hypothetical protein